MAIAQGISGIVDAFGKNDKIADMSGTKQQAANLYNSHSTATNND